MHDVTTGFLSVKAWTARVAATTRMEVEAWALPQRRVLPLPPLPAAADDKCSRHMLYAAGMIRMYVSIFAILTYLYMQHGCLSLRESTLKISTPFRTHRISTGQAPAGAGSVHTYKPTMLRPQN